MVLEWLFLWTELLGAAIAYKFSVRATAISAFHQIPQVNNYSSIPYVPCISILLLSLQSPRLTSRKARDTFSIKASKAFEPSTMFQNDG